MKDETKMKNTLIKLLADDDNQDMLLMLEVKLNLKNSIDMIQIDSLLYKIDQKLNKLSTNEHQQIQLEDKILALNEAQIKLIKQKVDGGTANGMGMDSLKKDTKTYNH
jgi:hypothetical protein